MTGAAPGRPNVLVIMSDEQSWNTMGCTHNPAARTPHLDSLAGRGRVFDGMYTPFPLCCPSRTSLMTGLMPRHHHVLGNWRGIRPDLADRGLGRWFADAGYHTFYVGKWHLPGSTPARMGFAAQAAIPAVLDGKDRGRYIPAYRDYARANGFRLLPDHIENVTAEDVAGLRDPAGPHRTTASIPLEHYLEPWQTRQFADVLHGSPTDRPWFGYCSFNAPHFPMVVPRPYDTIIDRSAIELPASWQRGFDDLPKEVRRSHFARRFVDLDEDGWREVIAHYYGMISMVDDQVGVIVELLRRRGELENTIIVFTSDHGDMMGAHRLMEKGHLLHYEESVHIPLIITHPDGLSGRDSALHTMPDLSPTLLDLAGIATPAGIDGISFADEGSGRDAVITESVLWDRNSEDAHGEHRDPAGFRLGPDTINLSIRDHDHRYIYRSDDVDELYDHRSDPAELNNIAGQCPELVAIDRERLAAEVGDVFPQVAEQLRTASGHPLSRKAPS
ncbi:sulfatase family protein [Microlunatus soli]|uniref:Arylsulfatase A n=1 Tax=Microlunatus soli TaxID=630515 RepID=A0A1H1Z2M4_9ACTN|nr:sulfatase-like hydrolase/transferase [Microlunatus soli]SDT27853.1 Arylsulfatase A [Microlunatus soli]